MVVSCGDVRARVAVVVANGLETGEGVREYSRQMEGYEFIQGRFMATSPVRMMVRVFSFPLALMYSIV